MQSQDVFTAPMFPGDRYVSVNKQIGSEWTIVLSAIATLEEILHKEEQP